MVIVKAKEHLLKLPRASLCLFFLVFTVFSCKEGVESTEQSLPCSFSYQLSLVNEDGETHLTLDDFKGCQVASIDNDLSWVTVSQAGVEDDCPVLAISTKGTSPNTGAEGDVNIVMSDGSKVELTLSMGVNYIPDNNGMEEFLTNWEDIESLTLNSTTAEDVVSTPWADVTSSNIPESIRRDVKKADGWQMAFSTLGGSNKDLNYFGLYNKYFGILRVFYYVTDAAGSGSEYCLDAILGSTCTKTGKQPFYNSLMYSIPFSCKNISPSKDLTGSSRSNTFQVCVTPWLSTVSTALARGWTAFDLDLSGYTDSESLSKFFQNEKLTLSIQTQKNENVHLNGTLSANLSGTYDEPIPETCTSSTSGIAALLSNAGSTLGNVATSSILNIEKVLSGSDGLTLNSARSYAGTICNVAAMAIEKLGNEEITEYQPGKIEMNMTGDISMSGYIKGFSQNQAKSLSISFKTMKEQVEAAGGKFDLGSGVWGIAEPPTIYVVDDHCMGTDRRLNFQVKDKHSYLLDDAASYGLRMITFLDPTTVKININTKVFPDVQNVNVITYCGVYPDKQVGHTDKFRSLLNLSAPDTVDILNYATHGAKTMYQSWKTDEGYKMAYHQITPSDLKSGELQESSCDSVKQTGASYRYYGDILSGTDSSAPRFIADPQVSFPTGASVLYDGDIPDFVVVVMLSFTSNGKTYNFVRRCLPNVRTISGTALASMKTKLTNYSNNSKNGSVINYVNGNNTSIPVIHREGYKNVARTLKILNTILK